MKLLIVTQAIDTNEQALGFFVRWVRAFASHYEEVTVICLTKGSYIPDERVRVFSLGKEEGKGKGHYVRTFFQYIWKERARYDAVLVHMNQEYVLLGGVLWRLLGKRILLWRNHKDGTVLTRLAVMLAHRVFCTSPQSYTAPFSKTRIMPVGIDTHFFSPGEGVERVSGSLLFLSRMDPIKQPHILVEALTLLVQQGITPKTSFVGSPTNPESRYYQECQDSSKELAHVSWKAGVDQEGAARLYREHDVFVNLTPAGSMDKTIGEALASGCEVVTSNPAFAEVPGCTVVSGDPHAVAAVLMSPRTPASVREAGREYIQRHHSLDALAVMLAREVADTLSEHALFTDWGQVLRYASVGVVGVVVNTTVLLLCAEVLGMWYLYAAVPAFLASLGTAFTLQKYWTFKDKARGITMQFGQYALIALLSVSLNMSLLYVAVDVLGLWYGHVQPFILIGIGFASFAANRLITFRTAP